MSPPSVSRRATQPLAPVPEAEERCEKPAAAPKAAAPAAEERIPQPTRTPADAAAAAAARERTRSSEAHLRAQLTERAGQRNVDANSYAKATGKTTRYGEWSPGVGEAQALLNKYYQPAEASKGGAKAASPTVQGETGKTDALKKKALAELEAATKERSLAESRLAQAEREIRQAPTAGRDGSDQMRKAVGDRNQANQDLKAAEARAAAASKLHDISDNPLAEAAYQKVLKAEEAVKSAPKRNVQGGGQVPDPEATASLETARQAFARVADGLGKDGAKPQPREARGTDASRVLDPSAPIEVSRAAARTGEEKPKFAPLATDDCLGPKTRAQLQAYQKANGLAATGDLTPETLDSLRASAAQGRTAASVAAAAQATPERPTAQGPLEGLPSPSPQPGPDAKASVETPERRAQAGKLLSDTLQEWRMGGSAPEVTKRLGVLKDEFDSGKVGVADAMSRFRTMIAEHTRTTVQASRDEADRWQAAADVARFVRDGAAVTVGALAAPVLGVASVPAALATAFAAGAGASVVTSGISAGAAPSDEIRQAFLQEAADPKKHLLMGAGAAALTLTMPTTISPLGPALPPGAIARPPPGGPLLPGAPPPALPGAPPPALPGAPLPPALPPAGGLPVSATTPLLRPVGGRTVDVMAVPVP
jgi:hypothetical protein